MKVTQLLTEANVAAKIKDPKTIKMLAIAMRHDSTLPKHMLAKMGPKPTDEDTVRLWSELLDKSLQNTDYGDISRDGKFDEWLTRLYTNGFVDYEDVNGEGGDALGAWKALSVRGKLKEPHQDFNKFRDLKAIQRIVQDPAYREELRRIKDAEVIEKHKREKKETTLIDDERFLITVPFNYGACYTFNNAHGFNASFCTGSSSGLTWFNRYADEGPLISVFDKANPDDVNGKWQIHAPTNQMNNGNQTISYSKGDAKFAELFPGLLKKIIAAIQSKAEEIKDGSKSLTPDGYDINKAVADLKKTFPAAYASEAESEEPEDDQDGPGTYKVTQISSGRSAKISGDSKQDVVNKVLARYPDSTEADYTFEKQDEE
jgi:hypothetical protein